jgi:hypothetical protein
MRVAILKSFPFSRDGIATLSAIAGSDEDIPDRLISGLQREGFVRETAIKTPAESVTLFPAEPVRELAPTETPVVAVSEFRDDVPQRDRRKRGK